MDDKELQRFWKKVYTDPNSGCWLWGGFVNHLGYGQLMDRHRKLRAPHRMSYEHYKKAIPKGLVIDHLCKNPSCVNPDHLEAVTQKENVMRGTAGDWQINKTHCPKGHEYTPENTFMTNRGRSRACRECARAKNRIENMTPEQVERSRICKRDYMRRKNAEKGINSYLGVREKAR